MVTQEMYDKGIRCRGICSICSKVYSDCYQYIVDVKGTKFDREFTEEKIENNLNRDVEILVEIIADNLEVIKEHGDIDTGIFEDVCNNLGFDLYGYTNKHIRGHFKRE